MYSTTTSQHPSLVKLFPHGHVGSGGVPGLGSGETVERLSSRMAARIQRSLRKSRDPRCHVRGEQTGDFSDRQSLLVSQDVISKGVHLCFFLFLFLRLFPRWHPLVAVAAAPVASETFSSRQILFLPAIHVPDKPELCGRS
ncbi:hypothetical protein V8C40DRAFT_258203 [Trichoderma camerunense]